MSALCREVKVDWICRLTSAKLQYWLIFVNIFVFVASMTDQLQSTHKLVSYRHQRCQMLMSQTVSLERVASSRWEFPKLKLNPWRSGGVFIRAKWQSVWTPKSWNNILFGQWYWIDINTIYLKEEPKINFYVTMAIRYMWFVLESNLYNSIYTCFCSDWKNASDKWTDITLWYLLTLLAKNKEVMLNLQMTPFKG